MSHSRNPPRLGTLESAVMQVVWSRQRVTADEVRGALQQSQELKDSTVRTILRRLEGKGYVDHEVDGRTYVYRPRILPENLAVRQVRGIVDRFCRGSLENLLVGMVDEQWITPDKLRELADRISDAETIQKRKKPGRGKK